MTRIEKKKYRRMLRRLQKEMKRFQALPIQMQRFKVLLLLMQGKYDGN